MTIAGCRPALTLAPTAPRVLPPVTLTASAPVASLVLQPSPGAAVVGLTMVEVSPGTEGFVVSIEVHPNGGQPTSLGTVSLFPVGQPGHFVVSLRGAADAVGRAGGTLTLTLEPLSADRPLSPQLEVGIRDVELATAAKAHHTESKGFARLSLAI